jgi:phage protein D
MTVYTPLVQDAARPENRHLYVPAFAVLVDGSGLPQNVLRDITELTYRDNLIELDQFELTVNNWDATSRRCKFIGSETAADLNRPDSASLPFKLFEPCSKLVDVQLGYVGRLISVMSGNFTTMEPSFPSSGAPILTVRGLNVLHQLRRKKYSTAWINKTPSQIARNLASLADAGRRRFPANLEIIPGGGTEPQIAFIAQTSQYDIDFLLNLARQYGYDISVSGDRTYPTVRFGFAGDARLPVNYRLDWGRTLIDFKPTLTTAGQFKSVTVRGWDRTAQRPIEEKVAFDDPRLRRMNQDLGELVIQCDPREEQVVDLPVFSRADANRRAMALMRDNNARMVRATGTTVGMPDLRAGTKVDIQNVGARLSGEYLVTKTTHTIGDGGYTTKFECRREDFTGAPR